MPGKILIVDDEAAIREMVSLVLRQHGYECRTAQDVNEAQNLIVNDLPDLVLLDWMLPGISGFDYPFPRANSWRALKRCYAGRRRCPASSSWNTTAWFWIRSRTGYRRTARPSISVRSSSGCCIFS